MAATSPENPSHTQTTFRPRPHRASPAKHPFQPLPSTLKPISRPLFRTFEPPFKPPKHHLRTIPGIRKPLLHTISDTNPNTFSHPKSAPLQGPQTHTSSIDEVSQNPSQPPPEPHPDSATNPNAPSGSPAPHSPTGQHSPNHQNPQTHQTPSCGKTRERQSPDWLLGEPIGRLAPKRVGIFDVPRRFPNTREPLASVIGQPSFGISLFPPPPRPRQTTTPTSSL